jgi:uncharacterized protein YcaQ
VLSPRDIFALVARTVVRVLAPAPERTVRSILMRLSRRIAGITRPAKELEQLVEGGMLVRQLVSGLSYLWLARSVDGAPELGAGAAPPEASAKRVRFLAPFDPLVWDRLRFEQLWGWSYRFEAYTPASKRVRGYYAMPLCWGDDVIGWANVEAKGSSLDVDLGFVGSRPKSRDFGRELEREVESLRAFLVPRSSHSAAAEAAAEASELRATAAPGSSRPRASRQSLRRPS